MRHMTGLRKKFRKSIVVLELDGVLCMFTSVSILYFSQLPPRVNTGQKHGPSNLRARCPLRLPFALLILNQRNVPTLASRVFSNGNDSGISIRIEHVYSRAQFLHNVISPLRTNAIIIANSAR